MQTQLPFAQAEATAADRRNLLGLALLRVGADLHLATFCRLTLEAEERGRPLVKTYEQLRDAPWGLCCGRTKCRAAVKAAIDGGIVKAQQTSHVKTGGAAANQYRLDWDGIRTLLGLMPRRECHPPDECAGPPIAPVATRHPHVATRHPHVATRHPTEVLQERESFLGSKNLDFVVVDDKGLDWSEILKTARETAAAVFGDGRRPQQRERELLLAAAILAHTHLGRGWLNEATAAVARRSPRNPGGFFRACCRNAIVEYLGLCSASEAPAVFGRALCATRQATDAWFAREAARKTTHTEATP